MKRFVWLGAFVALIVIVWSGAWFAIAGVIRSEIEAQGDPALESRLTCGQLDVAGFPFRFDITCAQATLIDADVTTTSPQVKATALAYRPTHLLAFVEAPLTLTDAFTGSVTEVGFTGGEVSIRLDGLLPDDLAIARISAVADDIAWRKPLFGEALVGAASHAELHLLKTEDPDSGLAFSMRANGLAHAEAGISGGDLEIGLDLQKAPRRVTALASSDALRAWQAAGGAVEILAGRFTADGLSAESSGTLALTDEGYLNGSIRLTSNGIFDRFDLSALGPLAAVIAGTPDASGTYTTSIAIRRGVVMAGLLPVEALPPLF